MEYLNIIFQETYKILFLLVPVLVSVAMIVWLDRRVWAFVQKRQGPNVVGPFGLLQSVADALKYIFKELIIPASSNKVIFIIAPIIHQMGRAMAVTQRYWWIYFSICAFRLEGDVPHNVPPWLVIYLSICAFELVGSNECRLCEVIDRQREREREGWIVERRKKNCQNRERESEKRLRTRKVTLTLPATHAVAAK